MTSHLGLMLIFSSFVSVVFAVLTKDDPKDQIALGARLFGGFVGCRDSDRLAPLSASSVTTGVLRFQTSSRSPLAVGACRRVLAAIFFVSGLPIAPLPDQVSDKNGHFAAYLGLAVLAAASSRRWLALSSRASGRAARSGDRGRLWRLRRTPSVVRPGAIR